MGSFGWIVGGVLGRGGKIGEEYKGRKIGSGDFMLLWKDRASCVF